MTMQALHNLVVLTMSHIVSLKVYDPSTVQSYTASNLQGREQAVRV